MVETDTFQANSARSQLLLCVELNLVDQPRGLLTLSSTGAGNRENAGNQGLQAQVNDLILEIAALKCGAGGCGGGLCLKQMS